MRAAPIKSPYDRAREVYEREPCARPFESDLLAHLRFGFVFSRPDFFVMGRPVVSSAPASEVVDPWVKFDSGECDCWHVFLLSGNLVRALEVLPWSLEFMSMERRNKLRIYKLAGIARLLSGREGAENTLTSKGKNYANES